MSALAIRRCMDVQNVPQNINLRIRERLFREEIMYHELNAACVESFGVLILPHRSSFCHDVRLVLDEKPESGVHACEIEAHAP